MTDHEHCVELIHAELDGELTGQQRAELNRALLADPAVRALREQLRRLCQAIDTLPPEEPPADLCSSVMESLPASPPVCEDRDVHPRGWRGSRSWRYAAAFAGGLFVSALAFQFALDPRGLDSHDLAGTLAADDPSRLELRLAAVRGTVELEGTATAPVVLARLQAGRPIEVIARLDGQEVRLRGFVAARDQPTELSAAFSRAALSSPAVVAIEVIDEATGAVLRSAQLRPDAAD